MRSELGAIEQKRDAAIQLELKALEKVHDQYTLALKRCKETAQSVGDLDTILAANTALENQDRRKIIGVSSDSLKVKNIQQSYKDAYENTLKQIAVRRVTINRDYYNQLDDLVKKLTQAGMVNEALEVRKLKDQFIEQIKTENSSKITIQEKPGKTSTTESQEMRAGTERDFEIAKNVKIRMCWIPPGEFIMGSPLSEVGRNNDETQHSVKLTKGFWMAKTELTQLQWEKVMGSKAVGGVFGGDDMPVCFVSWYDLCGDSNRNGGFLGKANMRSPNGWRFDLPTEAEWEYATRAGSKEALYSGFEITTPSGNCPRLDDIAWYRGNSSYGNTSSNNRPHRMLPVGRKKPNKWGLHDTLGNVAEWTSDGDYNYATESVTDPKYPIGKIMITRGGNYMKNPRECRSASRLKPDGSNRSDSYGARLVLRHKE